MLSGKWFLCEACGGYFPLPVVACSRSQSCEVQILQRQLFEAKSFADENAVAEKMRQIGVLPNIPVRLTDVSTITREICHQFR